MADGARPTAPKSSAMLLLDQLEKRMGRYLPEAFAGAKEDG